MKQLIILYVILVGIMLFAAWLSNPDNQDFAQFLRQSTIQGQKPAANNSEPKSTPPNKTPVMMVGSNKIEVEVANTQDARRIGLTKYTSLPENRGMLFVFDDTDVKPVFWMVDMKFPIDIIWIDDNKVVEITPDLPPVPNATQDDKIPRYSPTQTIDFVLELPAGDSKRKGIDIGDPVEIPQI